ncbi:hypothetical protein ABLE93_16975 [Xanthobacter sp. KR7-65]
MVGDDTLACFVLDPMGRAYGPHIVGRLERITHALVANGDG